MIYSILLGTETKLIKAFKTNISHLAVSTAIPFNYLKELR